MTLDEFGHCIYCKEYYTVEGCDCYECKHPNLEQGIYYDYCPDCGYEQGY